MLRSRRSAPPARTTSPARALADAFVWLAPFAAVLALAGCGAARHDADAAGQPAGAAGTVEAVIDVATVPKSTLDAWSSGRGIGDLAGAARCDVQVRQLLHRTTGPGDAPARNSAALLVPRAGPGCTGPFALLAYARGTSTDRSRTLANPGDPETQALLSMFAARGYVVVATDYLGFGGSDFPYNPYLDAESEAASVADSIVAAHRVMADEGVPLSPGVFLAGYSLGGHAILAAQRRMEAAPLPGLPVVATGAMSGPYVLSVTFADGLVAQLFPSLGDDVLRAAASPARLLLADRLALALDRFVGIDAIRDALDHESVIGWRPVAPLMLCAGARDPVVPYANTTAAAADFRARGAQVVVVDVDTDPAFAGRVPVPGTADLSDYHAGTVPPLCVQAVRDRLFEPLR